MNFADQKMVKKLRKKFPVGCRIVLDEMDDRQAPPIGTQGTCNGVDDAGNILVSWDTGSHLNVAYGKYHVSSNSLMLNVSYRL